MKKTKRSRHAYTLEQENELLQAVNDPNAGTIKSILKDFAKRWKIKPATLNSKLVRLRQTGPSAPPAFTKNRPSARHQEPDIAGANCIRIPIKNFTIQQKGDQIELVMMLH